MRKDFPFIPLPNFRNCQTKPSVGGDVNRQSLFYFADGTVNEKTT